MILKLIYGKTDITGVSYTRPHRGGEDEFSTSDSITFSIAFQAIVHIENKPFLLVITEAPDSYQQGSSYGYKAFYFFKENEKGFSIVDSIVSDEQEPLGNVSNYQIVDIGKNKEALVSTFQNSHGYFTQVESLYYITLGALTHLVSITDEYDNSDWNTPETEDDECNAEKSSGSFEIIRDNKDWYDIKVNETEYGFTKGCQESYVKKETESVYSYNGQEYVEQKESNREK